MSNVLSIFDTQKAAEQAAELHLRHPVTGEPTYADGDKKKKPLIINLKGIDSGDFEKDLQRRIRKNKGKGKDSQDLEEAKLAACETYANLTTGWQNIPGDDGKDLEFSFESAVKLYMKYKDIRVQISDFIADKSNFIKG